MSKPTYQELEARIATLEKQLEEKSEFETIFDNLSSGILLLSPDRVVKRANNRYCEIIGVTAKELISNSISFVHDNSESFKGFGDKVYPRIWQGETVAVELKTKNFKTNKEIFLGMLGKALDIEDHSKGSIWTIVDFTKEKQLELEKEKALKDFESIFNNSAVGIFLGKEQNHFARVNNKALEILGCTDLQDFADKGYNFFLSDDARDQFIKNILPDLLSGEACSREFQVRRKNGEVIWIKLFGKAINPDNLYEGTVWVLVNINERKLLEAEREKLVSELQSALNNIKTLKGLLPICAKCKKIRDDRGEWEHVEVYIKERSDTQFSHGICPSCAKEVYGNEDWFDEDDFKD
jgi:PAS domain S-box-containing protein